MKILPRFRESRLYSGLLDDKKIILLIGSYVCLLQGEKGEDGIPGENGGTVKKKNYCC